MAGLGFRLLRGAERMAGSRTFEFRRFDGHMFYGLGGSLSNFVQVNGASAFLKQLKPGASLLWDIGLLLPAVCVLMVVSAVFPMLRPIAWLAQIVRGVLGLGLYIES